MAITKIALSITYDDGRVVALEVDTDTMVYMARQALCTLMDSAAGSSELNLSHDTHLRAIELASVLGDTPMPEAV